MNGYQGQLALLKQRINQLDEDYRAKLAKEKRKFEQELKRLEQRMIRQNETERKKLEQEYRRKIKEYQRFIRGEITSLDKELQEEIRQKNREISSLKRQMKEIENNLKKNIEGLKQNIKEDLKRKREIAGRYVNEFRNVVAAFTKIPHQKFTPDKLDTIKEVEKEFNILDDGEMYEAKTAVAISSTSALHRLEIEVAELSDQWVSEYQLYKQYTSHLFYSIYNHMVRWEVDYAKKINEIDVTDTFYLNDFDENKINIIKEIDFWSFGKYLEYFNQLEQELELIKEIEHRGIDDYLLDEESIAITTLIEKSRNLNESLNQLFEVYTKAQDNQEKYHLRKEIMNDIIKQFEIKRNVQKSQIKVEKAIDDSALEYVNYKMLAKKLIGDPRRSLHGILISTGDLEIHIYIRPEDLGDRYRNIILLYDDFGDQGYLSSAEFDDYQMLLRILRQLDLKIDDRGYEENDIWYIPFVDLQAVSNLQASKDINIQKFAGKLNRAIRRR
ncbi:hypothetical protein [Thomasclavelia spiroformis]|uniref:hypothetical protein n=1 Tax=Thomasclavelia spiroformis TaxID=29348 RepID=UPI0032080A6B